MLLNTNMIRACIVDDEKRGRDSLKRLLIEYCPSIEVVGEGGTVEEAIELINEKQPDLVFLDVEMPRGSGFDLLRRFDPVPFRTIFITAHQHYAIKAIRNDAVDYLLKPLDVDELVAAVDKMMNSVSNSASGVATAQNILNSRQGKIAVPVKDGIAFLHPDEIIRLQADGSYTHIFTVNGRYTASKNIKEYEDILNAAVFFRAHHSHLINLSHVKSFSRAEGYFVLMSDGSEVEVSRRRKEDFLRLMNG